MSNTQTLIDALRGLETGWDARGRKGPFRAATFTDVKGQFFGLWHRQVLLGAVARWPVDMDAGKVAYAMDCSAYALAGLGNLIDGAQSALIYIVDTVPTDHGQWQVGEAWGGLESGLKAMTGRDADVRASGVTEHENRWGSIVGPFAADNPSELLALKKRLAIERDVLSRDAGPQGIRTECIKKIEAAISASQEQIYARFPGTQQVGHPNFDHFNYAARWGEPPCGFEVIEYFGDSDPACGGSADHRELLVNGLLRESRSDTLPVALFETLEQAHQAAMAIPNRRSAGRLGVAPKWN